ncbi:MAG: ABC transporter permease [Saprospiraceae bacterium]|nr:ABC transporter permease [Saprospiraceae bacterium]
MNNTSFDVGRSSVKIELRWRRLICKEGNDVEKLSYPPLETITNQRRPFDDQDFLDSGVGIAASLLLMKYISWQWNFDRFHTKGREIVRIQNNHFVDGVLNSSSAMTYSGVPVLAKDNFPEVKNYVRLGRWIANDVEFRYGENLFRGKNCFFTDPSFFDIFSFEMLLGDPKTALLEPNSLVLSESTAKKLFGDDNPIGEEVIFESTKTFQITGVVKDPPVQSHIQFEILGSLNTMSNWGLDVYGDDQLGAAYIYAYLELSAGSDLLLLASKITNQVRKLKTTEGGSDEFILQPIRRIHLYSDLDHEIQTTGQGNNIWILTGIAILILLLAWVNHFNLFSANVLDQAQVLSIRRIVGASRGQLFSQLAFAAFLFNFLGLAAGIVIMLFSEPLIENIFGFPIRQFALSGISASDPAGYLVLLIVIGTFSNSFLPALTLSKIKATSLLTKQFPIQTNGFDFRRLLVIFQFAIIVALIAATGIIYQQTRFMQSEDLGLVLDDVIAIRAPLGTGYENLEANYPRFKEEINQIPEITSMSVSKDIPGNQLEMIDELIMNGSRYSWGFYRNYGDEEYFRTYKIPFLVRDTTVNLLHKEQRYVVINKMAADFLGFKRPNEALQAKITLWGDKDLTVAGVVENYHQRSLHHPVLPIIYDYSADGFLSDGYYSLKIDKRADTQVLIKKVNAMYSKAFPHTVFDHFDVSDYFSKQYEEDNRFKKLNLGFTLLGLIIACFGLFGLMIITVEKRIKELGIRKVLGASLGSLVLLLSKDMIKITAISWAIATPIVWYLMNEWLNNFSSRIEIRWSVFIWAAILVLLAAFLTTGSQALKAALVDPAKILRDE